MDKTPSSFEYCLLLFSSELEWLTKKKFMMSKLIIDAANYNIFLTIINDNDTYNVSYENSKIHYEKLVTLIDSFLNSKKVKLNDVSSIYVNRGPGSFAGIRNSLSIVKAIHFVKKIDYYCYSFQDFNIKTPVKYENIPNLCDKFNVKKNLINPVYLS